MNDNDFLKSYKKNLENEGDMFIEEPPIVENNPTETIDADKSTRRATSAKGKATRSNPTRRVETPNESMTFEEKSAFYAPDKYSHYASAPQTSGRGGGNNTRNIIVIALMTVLLVASIFMVISISSKVKIIDFTGWQKNDFILWTSENKVNAQTEEIYDDNVEEGRIISQLIPAGEKINRNQFVKVFVSKGPDMSVEYDLPDIMNMTKDEIEEWADENLMSKVRISIEYSDTIPKGNVITFEINDETVFDKVKRDTPIYVIISKGSEEENEPLKEIRIPDFKSLGLTASMVFCQENGLVATINNQYDEYVPENTIISQSLSVNSVAHPGDSVIIVVSQGKMRTMPSFKQLDKSEAMSMAGQLGVPLKIKERYSSSDAGRMIYQSVPVGEQITSNTTLELTYSLGPQIAVGDFVGMQKFSIDEWLSGENEYGARISLKVTYTQNSAPSGIILQQSIKNTYVYRDTVINIVVSTGNVVFVPDFVAVTGAGYDLAITRDKAEDMVEGLGLILLFTEDSNASRLPGEIWWQSIPAGTEVDVGAIITLKYNPVNATLDVPDFTGKTVSEVMAMSEYDSLNIVFELGTAGGTPNEVYYQSVTAHSTVAYGTEIKLYIYE